MLSLSRKIKVNTFITLFALLLAAGCQTAPVQTESPETSTAPETAQKTQKGLPDIERVISYQSPAAPKGDEKEGSPELGLIFDSKIPSDQVGYVLYDPEKKKTLSQFNAQNSFIPSSVAKVISTAAALKILGSQYKFKTEVLTTGAVKKHILHGDVYLRGTGDPLLSISDLMELVSALKNKGIQQVKGRFYYDDTFLTKEKAIDPNHDEEERYNTGISALSLEYNQFFLYWKRSPKDIKTLEVYSLPEHPLLEVGIKSAADDSGAGVTEEAIEEAPAITNKEFWKLDADLAKKGVQRLPVRDPSLFTASVFRNLAGLLNIDLPQPQAKKTPAKLKPVRIKESLPLLQLSEKVLEYSNNTMAELIQLAAARKLSGKPLSIKDSAEKIQAWLKRQISELPGLSSQSPQPSTKSKNSQKAQNSKTAHWKDFSLVNGSGLGELNQVTPAQLAAVLNFANQSKLMAGHSYSALLPISGWKGTISQRLQNPDGAFRVWAKTGTQSYCNSLGGYLYTRSGKKLIFAILANDSENRRLIDLHLAPQATAESRTWGNKIRQLQDELLTEWIKSY